MVSVAVWVCRSAGVSRCVRVSRCGRYDGCERVVMLGFVLGIAMQPNPCMIFRLSNINGHKHK